MDGRPHPPAWAPHTFRGFSTGRFVGNALVVRTTHMKNGALRRGNGVPQSDQATLTEFFVRHGDHLTNVTVVTDPVFLSEPMVRSNDFCAAAGRSRRVALCVRRRRADPRPAPRTTCRTTCSASSRSPVSSPRATSCRSRRACSGAVTMYPELATRLRTVTNAEADALLAPVGGRAPETSKGVDPEPRDGSIHVLASPRQRLHAGRRRRQHRRADRRSRRVRGGYRRRQAVREGASPRFAR